MSESEPQLENRIFGSKAALAFGIVLIGGMSVVSLLAFQDEPKLSTLEKLDNPTAVGDPVTATIPANRDQPIATVHGKPMYAGVRDKYRELEMAKAGTDDSGKVILYHLAKRGDVTPELWVRVDDQNYIQLLEKPLSSPAPQP